MDVIIRIDGRAGRITLNRPRALNALTLQMVTLMEQALLAWVDDPAVRIVIIDAAGGRSFCAGGDIAELYDPVKAGDIEAARRHCRTEYALDALIATYSKPVVTLMDGMTMGGGIGISAHASHTVATENTAISVPECSVGFVPDSGATHILSRAPGHIGEYAALTGVKLNAADAIDAGFASVYVVAEKLPELSAAIAASGEPDLVFTFAGRPEHAGGLLDRREDIDAVFGLATLAEIVEALSARDDDEWHRASLRRMNRGSPLSLAMTLRAIQQGRLTPDLAGALRTEYRLVCGCMEHGDFLEGVRAALIDRDREPRWKYGSVEDVPSKVVDGMFAPPESGDFDFIPPGSGTGWSEPIKVRIGHAG
ncbi:enoyl-CoA hydratase/isomerase family protein [Mesorhizobium sp. BE184]|uniref:enoyl-CoA hydratase/isomerase family protein n=1 Tax=Mesorhizobium sp. BE184 TaxID=2817714 RepID=UPI002862BDAF|nr:enoyl-CoA hydratase/isomerase family protein [Mesorhizobium sp. BE184]MDR7033729.1 enoyl-CoA hydratase [Mesorhizobium sp. BE184]